MSNTNIAVDTGLERVAERLMGEPDFHQGLVLRQGPIVKEELRQKFSAQVILEEIVARMGKSLRHEREELSRQALILETEERALTTALEQLDKLEHARSNTSAWKGHSRLPGRTLGSGRENPSSTALERQACAPTSTEPAAWVPSVASSPV